MLSVILLVAGIGSSSVGIFIFTQALFAIGTILVVTPLIQKLVDDMLVEKWSEVVTIFIGITGFISLSVWGISSITEVTSVIDRYQRFFIVIGPGIIQLAWIFLVAEKIVFTQVEWRNQSNT